MKMTYDEKSDAIYLYGDDGEEITRTITLYDRNNYLINIDLDDETIMGIEIIGLHKQDK